MKISVVMTVYNGEEYVRDAVQSLLNQTYRQFEFIIVDDCSTDRTKQILSEFTDYRIKLFSLAENRGQTYSLNYGIERASGDWIFRQDADDVSLPTRIEKQVDFIKEHPETVALGTQIRAIASKRAANQSQLRAIEWSNALLTRTDIQQFRFIAPPVVHGSVAFSKEAFRRAGGYNESYRIGQDLDLWIRLLEIGPIDKVPEILYLYRVDPESISRKDETKTCRESLTISSFHIKRILESKLDRDPIFLVTGPEAGCDYFREEIAPANSLLIIDYLDEEQGMQKILEKYHRLQADAVIILDGKHSESHVTEAEQGGLTFNSEVFRLWNIYTEPRRQKRNPFVSVVVPCFNAVYSIKNTILSLDWQSYPRDLYEVIVVDDASTDHSWDLLQDLTIGNLQMIRHQQNKGAAGARNTGVAAAKGELIIFCDSDFIVPPWYIESHVKQHEGKTRMMVSGMGHWKYVLTYNFDREWSSFERKHVKKFYTQPFIKEKAAEGRYLVHESDIQRWDLDAFIFYPEYLTDWVQMAEGIYEGYGPNMEGFHLPWLSCCTGNLSINKQHFTELGGFDEGFTRLEDWEFGYRFYKSGGRFVYGHECEALQQLGPISSKRNNAQRKAYRLFCLKHPDFEVLLLSLLLLDGASFVELSNLYERRLLKEREEGADS